MLIIIRIMVLSLKTLPHPLFAFNIVLLVLTRQIDTQTNLSLPPSCLVIEMILKRNIVVLLFMREMFCNLNQDNEIDAVMTADTLVLCSHPPATCSYTHIWCCQKLYKYLYIYILLYILLLYSVCSIGPLTHSLFTYYNYYNYCHTFCRFATTL